MAMSFSTAIISPNSPLHKIPSKSPPPKPKSHHNSSPIPPSFDLQSYWTSMISLIESDLSSSIPITYPNRIHESMRYSLRSKSAKRAAPILCIASCELLGAHQSLALPTASALEMVHSASLIHNDLPCMDASPLRRGDPSNHTIFGVDFAVLTADALFPLAFRHVVRHTPAPPDTILRIVEEIARAVGSTGMAAGQMFDLMPEYGGGEEDVMMVLEKKFGEMGECSAVCGGLLGGAGEEELERLRIYGRVVGVLYEVVDDILMEDGKGKMRRNVSLVRAVGKERALEIVGELREKAMGEIEGFGEKYGERVLPLRSFVDYAVERDFRVERDCNVDE